MAAAVLLSAGASSRAGGEGKLEAQYIASIAGIPIGKGVWMIDVAGDQYNAAANGKTTGLLQVFAGGQGTVAGHGSINGKGVSSDYVATVVSDKKADHVHIALASGNVREYSAEPPLLPTPDRVPVSETHRRGVVDPMSATMMPVAGNGDPVRPEACNRTLAIFDGRGRFDLILSFKRMDRVQAGRGYQGPLVVCAVRYRPISGHRPDRPALKYLIAQRDIEVALAPLAGTRLLVPYRVSVPTGLGPAVLQATQFVTGPRLVRPAHATSNASTF